MTDHAKEVAVPNPNDASVAAAKKYKHDQHEVWKDGIEIDVCWSDCRACAIDALTERLAAAESASALAYEMAAQHWPYSDGDAKWTCSCGEHGDNEVNDQWADHIKSLSHNHAALVLAYREKIVETERALAYEMAAQIVQNEVEECHSIEGLNKMRDRILAAIAAASPNHDALIAAWKEQMITEGCNDMLRWVQSSLSEYPNGGGDIEVMRLVNAIINRACAERGAAIQAALKDIGVICETAHTLENGKMSLGLKFTNTYDSAAWRERVIAEWLDISMKCGHPQRYRTGISGLTDAKWIALECEECLMCERDGLHK